MGQADFTFRNETGEKIIVKHAFKSVTRETFTVENLHSETIQVSTDPQTYEKYWLYDSADKTTTKYVSSDEFKSKEQVTVVKEGGEFQLKFQERSEGFWKAFKKFDPRTWLKTESLPITNPSTSRSN